MVLKLHFIHQEIKSLRDEILNQKKKEITMLKEFFKDFKTIKTAPNAEKILRLFCFNWSRNYTSVLKTTIKIKKLYKAERN